MQVWWFGFKWSKKGFPPRKRPSVSTNERPTLLSRALWQPMRERSIEFAGFNSVFSTHLNPLQKYLNSQVLLGRAICHLTVEERGRVRSSLSSVSCVLNTDKTHFKCANSLFKCVFHSHCVGYIYSSCLKTAFTEYIHRHLSVIHFKCILTQIEWFCAIVNTLDIHSTHYQLFTISRICVYI